MSSRPEDQSSPTRAYPPATTVPETSQPAPPDQSSPTVAYPPVTTVPETSQPAPPDQSSPTVAYPPVMTVPETSQPTPPDQSSPKMAHPPATAVPETSQESQPAPPSEEEAKKYGTHIMGTPSAPNVHPDNQKASQWKAADHQQIPQQPLEQHQQPPYVQYSPINKPTNNPLEPVIHIFNSWGNRAENIARNVWHNLKTGHSLSEVAWGKVNLTAKAITEGGFESLFRQTFATDPNERLKKSFACYLSTSTGPVAGTLYLSTARIAFCSDRPLTFSAPSGQSTWSHYKVMIPVVDLGGVEPVVIKESPPEKYLQVVTTDGHEFWFMGFVNFEKASHHLLETVSGYRAAGTPGSQGQAQPVVV